MIKRLILFFCTICIADLALAQTEGLPLKSTQKIAFTTDEVTWMNVDISPDGKTLVFDMLGDLYLLPATGGKAERMTSGRAHDNENNSNTTSLKYVMKNSLLYDAETLDMLWPTEKQLPKPYQGDEPPSTSKNQSNME